MIQFNQILDRLKELANPKAVEGMARFGITTDQTLGVSIPNLRKLAKEIGVNHELSLKLWNSGFHEARILAGMIDNPNDVTEEQMEVWVKDFDSWDVCDQCCMNLFDETKFAYQKALEWSGRKEEFTKRAGFVLMACLAVSDKNALDGQFEQFFPIIQREAIDDKNFVKKAVNWALRQIGKRNLALNRKAVAAAREIAKLDARSARWISSDALRELNSEAVQNRLLRKR